MTATVQINPRRRRARQRAAYLLVLCLTACVYPPQAQSTGPFEPGRWESSDGIYFVELLAEGSEIRAILPMDTEKLSWCFSEWHPPAQLTGTWSLSTNLDGNETIAITFGPERNWHTSIPFREPGNWAVLEYYPCGPDLWPPLWLVRVD